MNRGGAALCLFQAGLLGAVLLAGGCAHRQPLNLTQIQADWIGPTTAGLTPPFFDPDVQAVCDPPLHWKPDLLKATPNHVHQAWLSPTGATAYGVIHFRLPFPVGERLSLAGFLAQMRHTEGAAVLLDRQRDPDLPGIRFVAQGGRYRIRANLIVDAWEGWVVYAGTFSTGNIEPQELALAQYARENTRLGPAVEIPPSK